MERASAVHYGATPVPAGGPPASGRLVEAFGEPCYVIEDVQALPPFLTTLVSDGDPWLFVASNGGLTAGRRGPGTALFPYVTEDKLADAAGTTGPTTALRCTRGGRTALWHPLAEGDRLVWRVRRRLYRGATGTRLVFEEENLDLGLTFRAGWRLSGRFGFLRECALSNAGPGPVEVHLLDGLLDLMPADATEALQAAFSVLVDAYKWSERLPGTPLAAYALAAQMVDRPEPREALHATTAWSHGLPGATLHLTAEARRTFGRGPLPPPADLARGQRGAYLLEAGLSLPAGGEQAWLVVADVARSQAEVAALRRSLETPAAVAALAAEAIADADAGAARVADLLAAVDGEQRTEDREACAHHLSNVLFNAMRGGVYAHGDAIPGPDFAAFVRAASRPVAARHAAFLAGLPALEAREAHRARVEALGDPDLSRLADEYLPLWFSRRHGDPSRPWNRFDIRVRDARGAPVLSWQGNWRDIFQNWESLSRSHPGFAAQLVAKFVNASTVDGHNPYRIGRDGVDWEVPEPDHPWTTIGYWGDHQLVYLGRLLELSREHHPAALPAWLEQPRFTYAEVPYALRPWADLVANPRDSIRFDAPRHARVVARVREVGSDGRLLHAGAAPLRVTLAEKLLVPALAKLAAYVPGGGVWMNTQRPEWNDANNALAGWGVSMVTLFHLDRYLEAVEALWRPLDGRETPLSREVAAWLEATVSALRGGLDLLEAPAVDDPGRERLMRALGLAAEAYRAAAYAGGPGAPAPAPGARLLELCALARRHLRHTIAGARRPDGLFHAYNVLAPRGPGRGIGLEHLEEMLEGQVAALSTHAVDDEAALGVLDALRASRLWREDQRSYLLYPDRRLPGFLEKNVLPEAALAQAPLLARLLAAGDGRVVLRDADGRLRFHGALHNEAALDEVLAAIAAEGFPGADAAAFAAVREAYEAVFHHRAFTGRSGSMFAYEGLGSIYWHMVGKLLLAVQERFTEAAEAGAPAALLSRLAARYDEIRLGMGGTHKTPAEWGAFPLDPYSHSPSHGGARQPGMTGQVKEEILLRLGELGVLVRGGQVAFRPRLLRAAELLAAPATFAPLGLDGRREPIALPAGALGFTLCQVPVIYRRSPERRLEVLEADGRRVVVPGDRLGPEHSAALLGRTGQVRRVEAWIEPGR